MARFLTKIPHIDRLAWLLLWGLLSTTWLTAQELPTGANLPIAQEAEGVAEAKGTQEGVAQEQSAHQAKSIQEATTEEMRNQEGVAELEPELHIYFRVDKAVLDPALRDNQRTLDSLDRVLDMIQFDPHYTLLMIEIVGSTSPEGGKRYNQALSERRSQSIHDYIALRHPITDSLIRSKGEGIAWDYLRELVAESSMSSRDQILWIIDNVEEETWTKAEGERWHTLTDSRLKQLMDLQGGVPYHYMYDHYFPLMRNSAMVTIHYNYAPLGEDTTEIAPQAERVVEPEQVPPIVEPAPEPAPAPTTPEPTPQEPILTQSQQGAQRPLFALKTNLLYDLMGGVNLEVEVPIGDRFSITGECIFPWWYSAKSNYTLRTQMVHLGVNYFLGDREGREALTGWHVGLNGGYANRYDVQLFSERGVQGDYLSAALTVGYAHALRKNLHLEYQLGLGWMQTNHQNYTMAYDTRYGDIKVFDYPWITPKQSWVGPTQLRVSLVWLINHTPKRECR